MAHETTYYSDGSVLVTAGRVVAEGTTHVLANVAAVSVTESHPDPRLPIAGIAVGTVLLAVGFLASGIGTPRFNPITLIAWGVLGLATLIAGVWARRVARPTYTLTFRTSSGFRTIFKDTDRQRMEQIVQAVKKALAARS